MPIGQAGLLESRIIARLEATRLILFTSERNYEIDASVWRNNGLKSKRVAS